MKFRTAGICLLSVFLVAPLSAETQEIKKMTLGLWGGYSMVGMSDVNNALRAAAGTNGSVTEIKSGTVIGCDFLYEIAPRLFVGPRIEYIIISKGKASLDTPLLTMSNDLYVIPVLVGGRYTLMEKDGWNLSSALFMGLGIGYGQLKVTTAADPTNQTVTKYSGSDIAGLFMVGGQYKVGENTYLGLDIGYRQLSISQMNVDNISVSSLSNGSGSNGYYAPSRAPVMDASGKTVTYDFSGIVMNVGINFRF